MPQPTFRTECTTPSILVPTGKTTPLSHVTASVRMAWTVSPAFELYEETGELRRIQSVCPAARPSQPQATAEQKITDKGTRGRQIPGILILEIHDSFKRVPTPFI